MYFRTLYLSGLFVVISSIFLTVWATAAQEPVLDLESQIKLRVKNRFPFAIEVSIENSDCYDVEMSHTGIIPPNKASEEFQVTIKPFVRCLLTGGKDGFAFTVNGESSGKTRFRTLSKLYFGGYGGLQLANLANEYHAWVAEWPGRLPDQKAYVLHIGNVSERLSAKITRELTKPVSKSAPDIGPDIWADSIVETLSFRAPDNSGLYDSHASTCFEKANYHPQHVVRLPNKDGHAYFMVSQSHRDSGRIALLKTFAGRLDKDTGVIEPHEGDDEVGIIIWQDVYDINPIGRWNHPGKMAVLGDVLVVAAETWESACPADEMDLAAGSASEDKVLFYDIRDIENPTYWGAMSASELGVGSVINTVGLVKAPNIEQYLLVAGGEGQYTTLMSDSISPKRKDWTQVNGPVFSGQHGMAFNSTQNSITISDKSPGIGASRLIFFDARVTGPGGDARLRSTKLTFKEFKYNRGSTKKPLSDIGSSTELIRDRLEVNNSEKDFDGPYTTRWDFKELDWNQASVFVRPRRPPIIYTVRFRSGDYQLIQIDPNLSE